MKMKFATLVFITLLSSTATLIAQDSIKLKAHFTSDTFRLEGGSKVLENIKLKFKVNLKDTSKSNWNLNIKVGESNYSSEELEKLKVPLNNKYSLKSLKTSKDSVFEYSITIPRNSKDDRQMTFKISADSSGSPRTLGNKDTSTVIYVKPIIADSLSTNNNWEFWIFTGTNFDFFDGIKADQFFFRSNLLFKISSKFYGQLAFFKNRYFSFDSSSTNSFSQQIPIIPPNDSIKYALGTFNKNVKQTTDIIGVSLDLMFKLGSSESVSTYFATGGFDISTRTIKLENTFSNFDSVILMVKRPGPDTAFHFSPLPPKSFSYQYPVYNFSVGFMWILNTEKINIKTHVLGGLSKFSEPSFRETSRGVNSIYTSYTKPYIQIRLFGTYKPSGISLGYEMFTRRNEIPQFNFTLSKVFDLSNFLNILTPVSALKLE